MNDRRPPVFARECDLVMKGGITSGIVYPLAISEIAKAFRLRSIGGTSAGAIAAAAAAAAELGRQRYLASELSEDPQGFAEIERLPCQLCLPATECRGTRLLALFRPAPALRSLFDSFTAALDARRNPLGLPRALLAHYWRAAGIGALLGGGPLWPVALHGGNPLLWLWLLGCAGIGALTAIGWRMLRQISREMPANGFALCSGMPGPDDQAPDEVLTPWLTEYLDRLCGQRQACASSADSIERERPLTFGELRRHGIDLQMMTTCASMARPFRLPFRNDEKVRENNQFHFSESEFGALFPQRVVNWMRARQRPAQQGERSDGLYRLPLPDDLPVVVAVRMSLSFPLLLSAVPLHAVDYRSDDRRLERCWFTDGGIASNFPIHFFDQALPTRPTFGLDLGSTEDADGPRVHFPARNGDARLAYWRRFPQTGLGALGSFLRIVMNVAKDWNHETLSLLPGFRDRIGLIQLTREEGGLNLTMPAERIARLTEYGRQAGIEFVRRFGDPACWPAGAEPVAMNWENHQSIRLRLMLASVAEQLASLERACSTLAHTPEDYRRFFSERYSYPFKGLGNLEADANGRYPSQAALALAQLEALRGLSRLLEEHTLERPGLHPADGAPKPTPELKLRPRV
ncbi:patatin-like phospholipase family protein [Ectopseudomonas hydrolytica]|uniref:patatin-like phospholipase family protein n=1 Tax=Ectopseudomonas hydrolytica TaxID=2493633 RepID=UPI0018A77109|nr:patatin-like phospholipase family protein [Pseudomonas hydrolytica]MBF8162512.1 patatin-like phospholipase family protein [Pseudomonas mendocina]UTH29564.1 patatin-like phospholipase family protein [Pseudomonas hydrolytica]UZZ08594.1 patatin-like phospholipase family protein [Pseudomonas mendocina]